MKHLVYFICFVALFFVSGCCREEDEPVPACDANCALEPQIGFCNAAIPKYYFDPVEKKCKQFIWGGCAGVVPFQTLEECESCGCK